MTNFYVDSSKSSLSSSIPSINLNNRSRQRASSRICNFMQHTITMLDQLQTQNLAIDEIKDKKLNQIYEEATTQIHKIKSHLHNSVNRLSSSRIKKINLLQKKLKKLQKKPGKYHIQINKLTKKLEETQLNLSEKKIKKLEHNLKIAEKEIAKIICNTQIKVVAELGEAMGKGTKNKVASLARGGLRAKWIDFLAMFSESHKIAQKTFNAAQTAMSTVKPKDSPEAKSELDRSKIAELKSDNLNRRAGVIGINGIYAFTAFFSQEKVHKQLKSFIAQNMGQIDRTTIERDLQINNSTFTSKLVPLNKEFDQEMNSKGVLTTNVFTSIFGTKGISSANRLEPHLINGWESNLLSKGKIIFRALRHAITSDKYEKNPEIRAKNSKKAAKELIKAALLQEIAAQGLTLEEAKKKGIQLRLNSVSLVTPDDLRPYLPGQDNEKKMLQDQISALKSFESGTQMFELDGIKIPVNVHVSAFNFGVNALADRLKMGLENQYEHNTKALKSLSRQHAAFWEILLKEVGQLERSQPKNQEQINRLLEKIDNSKRLMQDVKELMSDKKAYLAGDNQYEIGAKILNLSHEMDQGIEYINENKLPVNRISGFKCAFNCMSGKDRTGLMDAVAKSFAIMAVSNSGKYPSHQDLQNNDALRKKFRETLETVLLESGNLEITEINSGARGYKVKEEARLLGMSLEIFLQVQGLSSTTSS